MIILRIAGGIREHFGIRVPEWIMTLALFAWAGVLIFDPLTFDNSPGFAVIETYGDEFFWANICLAVGLVRLTALTVNGTFKGFRYSPHLRAVASLVSCFFWGQVTLGILIAWAVIQGDGTGVVAYSTFMVFEAVNLFRAWADVGVTLRRQ